MFISVVLSANTWTGQSPAQRHLGDPLIDLIVGDHHEDVIDDDVKRFAAHALGKK